METREIIFPVICIAGLLLLLVPAASAAAISFGETVTGTIVAAGETQSYSFSAVAGDVIYARIYAGWSYGPQLRLYAPDGTVVQVVTGSSDDTTMTQPLP